MSLCFTGRLYREDRPRCGTAVSVERSSKGVLYYSITCTGTSTTSGRGKRVKWVQNTIGSMSRKTLLCVVAVAGLVLLAGCTAGEPTNDNNTTVINELTENTDIIIDEDRGVVCYVYGTNGGWSSVGGISCLPEDEIIGT